MPHIPWFLLSFAVKLNAASNDRRFWMGILSAGMPPVVSAVLSSVLVPASATAAALLKHSDDIAATQIRHEYINLNGSNGR